MTPLGLRSRQPRFASAVELFVRLSGPSHVGDDGSACSQYHIAHTTRPPRFLIPQALAYAVNNNGGAPCILDLEPCKPLVQPPQAMSSKTRASNNALPSSSMPVLQPLESAVTTRRCFLYLRSRLSTRRACREARNRLQSPRLFTLLLVCSSCDRLMSPGTAPILKLRGGRRISPRW